MKKLVSIISILLVLTVVASAVTLDELSQSRFYTTTAADAVVEFMTENGLNEENFSMAYLNTATGELVSFNEHTLMLAASTYKLPLNMLYCDMIAQGVLTEETEITAELKKTLKEGEELPEGAVLIEPDSDSETTVDGEAAPVQYKISRSGIVGELMQKSLVDSDNDTSELLLRYAYEGQGYDHYLDRIKIYGNYDFSGFDREMLYDNYFPCDYMIGCLQYLYEHSGDYETVINYLKQAQPGMYFRRYLSCEVAHKYGYLGDNYNDVGIIYTETPFLLACYTDGLPNGENVVGRLAELMAEYTDYTTAHDKYVAEHSEIETEPSEEPEVTEEPTPLTEEEKLQQMIEEIEAIESAPVIVISPEETEEIIAEPEPDVSEEPVPVVTPQPEPVVPEPEKEMGILSLLLPAAVIVLGVVVIVSVLRSGGKKKKRRSKKGKHAAKR
ncbi:MAG: serine hydrolase [Ruminococcaceae bacterium]|nr:serine hydrolase [Oscillospiraceae bacterium]